MFKVMNTLIGSLHNVYLEHQNTTLGLGRSSAVLCLPSTHDDLGPIFSTTHTHTHEIILCSINMYDYYVLNPFFKIRNENSLEKKKKKNFAVSPGRMLSTGGTSLISDTPVSTTVMLAQLEAGPSTQPHSPLLASSVSPFN